MGYMRQLETEAEGSGAEGQGGEGGVRAAITRAGGWCERRATLLLDEPVKVSLYDRSQPTSGISDVTASDWNVRNLWRKWFRRVRRSVPP